MDLPLWPAYALDVVAGVQEGKVSFRLTMIAVLFLSLAPAGCVQTTEPIYAPAAASHPTPVTPSGLVESRPPHEIQVSGAFRGDEFVITVHGFRLEPDHHWVRAAYELDGEPQWLTGAYVGTDFYTSWDRRLWKVIENDAEDTGSVAQLKQRGNVGFTYSVPLRAMDEASGPVQFEIAIFDLNGGLTRWLGRAECRHCSEVAARP